MSGSGFALLLGFALVKIGFGLTLVYLGLRGGGRHEPEPPIGVLEPPAPSRPPAQFRSRRDRRPGRGGPRTPLTPRRARV